MHKPKYLSPTSLKLWRENREEFYMQHLAERRAPKMLQTAPMAIGSAFDAYVKSRLSQTLFGPNGLKFEEVFEAQVESHNRDWARANGEHVLQAYLLSGAYDDLLEMLKRADGVRFEFKAEKVIAGVPMLGRPDLHFIIERLPLVLDWKVKGYCSQASPSKGYLLCRDGYVTGKPSRSHNSQHPDFTPLEYRGLRISAGYLEATNRDYADQLSIYSWLEGVEPGTDAILWIEEIVAAKDTPPRLRVATHRARCHAMYQLRLLAECQCAWAAIQSGHIFTDMTRADSDARCEALDSAALNLATALPEEAIFNGRHY